MAAAEDSTASSSSTLVPQTDALLAHWDQLQDDLDALVQATQGATEALASVQWSAAAQSSSSSSSSTLQTQLVTYNQGQLADLQARLAAVVTAEGERRAHAAAQRRASPGLSWDQVTEILAPATILAERDALVSAWISTLLERSMAHRPVPTWDTDELVARAATTKAPTGCWTLLQAVTYLQEALTHYAHDDGLGLTDHARGSRIVHHATSPTYAATSTGGAHTPWRDYLIPQDWEDTFLPADWQDWWTTLASYLTPSLAQSVGVASTAPPEAVLEAPTWPGACWPMAGNRGQVTLVLPYSLVPTAISIDHASRLLVADASSAPRHVRIRAYAPCDDGKNCRGRDYDSDRVYDLFPGQDIEYDIHTTASVQTFWLPTPPTKKTAGNHMGDEEEVVEGATCTAPDEDDDSAAGACTGGDTPMSTITSDTLVRAIQMEILDNWGQGDYTCLYRIRVHGKPS
jgi:hypothetical protein